MAKGRPAQGPAGFARLKRFGWGPKEVWDIIGIPTESRTEKRLSEGMAAEEAAENVKSSSREFASYLNEHPNKVHVFPLTGTLLHYKFIEGMKDVLNPSVRLWAPVTNREKEYCGLQLGSKQLRQIREDGAVIHDYFQTHLTRDDIAKAAGIGKDTIVCHPLHPFEVSAQRVVAMPGTGKVLTISPQSMFLKDSTKGHPRLRPAMKYMHMTFKERKALRDAVYEAGAAAAEELLKERLKFPTELPSGNRRAWELPVVKLGAKQLDAEILKVQNEISLYKTPPPVILARMSSLLGMRDILDARRASTAAKTSNPKPKTQD